MTIYSALKEDSGDLCPECHIGHLIQLANDEDVCWCPICEEFFFNYILRAKSL
jgi:hypothetical protein